MATLLCLPREGHWVLTMPLPPRVTCQLFACTLISVLTHGPQGDSSAFCDPYTPTPLYAPPPPSKQNTLLCPGHPAPVGRMELWVHAPGNGSDRAPAFNGTVISHDIEAEAEPRELPRATWLQWGEHLNMSRWLLGSQEAGHTYAGRAGALQAVPNPPGPGGIPISLPAADPAHSRGTVSVSWTHPASLET